MKEIIVDEYTNFCPECHKEIRLIGRDRTITPDMLIGSCNDRFTVDAWETSYRVKERSLTDSEIRWLTTGALNER